MSDPQFVRSHTREVVVENGPDTFALSVSVWTVQGRPAKGPTTYDGSGHRPPEGDVSLSA